jgi:hypothetical protein
VADKGSFQRACHDLREQEGTGTRLYVLARTGLEDLHAMGRCFGTMGATLIRSASSTNLIDALGIPPPSAGQTRAVIKTIQTTLSGA